MPKNTMSQLRFWIKEAGELHGAPVNNAYAKKLAARFIIESNADEDMRQLDLTTETITYADPTGREAVRRWFESLINAQSVAA